MRPHSVGCIPTYSADRQPIAVRPAAVADTDGVLFDKPKLQEPMWPGLRSAPRMMRLHSM
jgi:hypothetical protein